MSLGDFDDVESYFVLVGCEFDVVAGGGDDFCDLFGCVWDGFGVEGELGDVVVCGFDHVIDDGVFVCVFGEVVD